MPASATRFSLLTERFFVALLTFFAGFGLAVTASQAQAATGGLQAAGTATTTSSSGTGGVSSPRDGTDTTATPTTTTAAAPVASSRRRRSGSGTVTLSSSKKIRVRGLPERRSGIGWLRNKSKVKIYCQVNSVPYRGRYGTSRIWNRVKASNGKLGYVPDSAMLTDKSVLVASYCGWSEPGAPAQSNPGSGFCSTSAPISLEPAPVNRAAFVEKAGPIATGSQTATQVPASVTLSQAILESASGTATAGANNYFGIKAQRTASAGIFSWSTKAVGCVLKPTFETERGALVRQAAAFRLYRSMQESFDDHGLFFHENPRYADAFNYTSDPKAFIRAIAKAGYATDPSYASLLIKLVDANDLTRFDVN